MGNDLKKIEGIDRFLIITAAVGVDAVQFFLFLIPLVGWVLSSIVAIYALVFFLGIFQHFNMHTYGARSILTRILPLVFEMVPLINIIPSYTIVTSLSIHLHNKHIEKTLEEEGLELGL